MALKTLYKTAALASGSNVWVIPDLSLSQWSKTIDWYLNFQISLAKNHSFPQIDEPLAQIMKQNEYPMISPSSQGPLLIACQNRLPTTQLVEIEGDLPPTEWIKKAVNTWQQLLKPPARFFLPSNMSPEQFEAHWPKSSNQLISLVPEWS